MHQCPCGNETLPPVEMEHMLNYILRKGTDCEANEGEKVEKKQGKFGYCLKYSHSRAPAYPLLVVRGHGICVLFGLFPQHFLHGEPFFW